MPDTVEPFEIEAGDFRAEWTGKVYAGEMATFTIYQPNGLEVYFSTEGLTGAELHAYISGCIRTLAYVRDIPSFLADVLREDDQAADPDDRNPLPYCVRSWRHGVKERHLFYYEDRDLAFRFAETLRAAGYAATVRYSPRYDKHRDSVTG